MAVDRRRDQGTCQGEVNFRRSSSGTRESAPRARWPHHEYTPRSLAPGVSKMELYGERIDERVIRLQISQRLIASRYPPFA